MKPSLRKEFLYQERIKSAFTFFLYVKNEIESGFDSRKIKKSEPDKYYAVKLSIFLLLLLF